MTFDVRATSADMLSPVHIYDGDEAIAPEAYRKAIYNGYISCVPFLYGAARGYGLDVDSDTFERWKRGTAAAGVIDSCLDDSPDPVEAQEFYQRELRAVERNEPDVDPPAWAPAEAVTAVRLLRNSVRRLPEHRLNELSGHARGIARIAFAKAQTSNTRQYRELLCCEADHTGALPARIVSDYVAGQPQYPRFERWCRYALRLGTFTDHALDLKDDYEAGRTAVKPGVGSCMLLAASAIWAASNMMAQPQGSRATATSLLYRGRYSLRFAETFVPRSVPDTLQ